MKFPHPIKLLSTRLQGGALAYSLIIGVIIGMLLLGMMLQYSLQKLWADGIYYEELALDNLESGLNLVLAQPEGPFGEQKAHLFDSEIDSYEIKSEIWGFYALINAWGTHGPATMQRNYLCGVVPGGEFSANLFLRDKGRPLTLAGEARLEGKIFIPKAGLKRGMVAKRPYQGSRLYYGSRAYSTGRGANADYGKLEDSRERLYNVWNGQIPLGNTIFAGDSIHQNWTSDPLEISSNYALNLQDINLSGKCIVTAPEITIGKNCKLEHVLLYGSIIKIESGFQGRLQAFASDSLWVEDEVKLRHPSSLVVANPDGFGYLYVGQGAVLEGLLLNDPAFVENPLGRGNMTSISKDAEIFGLCYASENLDLKGTVHGTVITGSFLLKTAASVNQNYILDGRITPKGILSNFPTGFIIPDPKDRVVITHLGGTNETP